MKLKLFLLIFIVQFPLIAFAQKTIKGKQIYYVEDYSEHKARQYLDTANELDPIEGFWVGESGYKYSIEKDFDGNKRNPNKYRAVIIQIPSQTVAEVGDIAFFLNKGSSKTLFESIYYLYRASWRGKNREYKIEPFTCISIKNGLSLISKCPVLDEDYGNIIGEKENTYFKTYPQEQFAEKENSNMYSGTGFFLCKDGYIITNYHVIENAENNNIKVIGVNGDYNKSYTAKVSISDKQNDLAILKIEDNSYTPIENIPYTFKFNISSIGEDCFVLGYPMISSMGKDIKLTNGIISSKTGYDGNVSQYQISAPIQSGNSGAPLFDKEGNIIGVVQAKHALAENAGYAIKASYIRNLIDLLPTPITLPEHNILRGKTLPQQVELASKAVCIIIVNGE